MSIVPGRDVPAVPDEWVDAVNAAINDANHEDLCACDGWPDACRWYKPGQWDLGVSLDIAIGVLEPLIRERIAAEGAKTVTTTRAAEIVGVSRATMIRFLDEGRLPYTQPGKHRRLRLADVLAFKEQVTHGAAP